MRAVGTRQRQRQIAEAPTRKREVVRQRESKPVVERFFAWGRDEATRTLDETPLAKGIRHALNERAALKRFLKSRVLELAPTHWSQTLERGAATPR